MYRELGGRSEYLRTPIRELQEMRISIIAEINVQNEKEKEIKAQQAERQSEIDKKLQALKAGMR
jgi:Arc/MetJ-type ribon-helix-helix transcriptional regulator